MRAKPSSRSQRTEFEPRNFLPDGLGVNLDEGLLVVELSKHHERLLPKALEYKFIAFVTSRSSLSSSDCSARIEVALSHRLFRLSRYRGQPYVATVIVLPHSLDSLTTGSSS